MKNNKMVVIIGIVLLNVMVIFMIGQSLLGKTSQYEQRLEEARAYAEQDLCKKAIAKYNDALVTKDTLEIRIEMLDIYEKGINSGELTDTYEIFNSVTAMIDTYREEPSAYKAACEFMLKYDKFEDCAMILMSARDANITFDNIEELKNAVRYQYTLNYSMYSQVYPTYDGMITVQADNGIYAYLNSEGATELEGKYTFGSSFSEGYAFVKFLGGDGVQKGFIIDKAGDRQAYINDAESSSGVGKAKDGKGNDVYLLSCKIGERYTYYDINGIKIFGDYAFAGRFRNNVAAVKLDDGTWQLIDGAGKAIVETKFADVILNEFDECAPKGLIIAKASDKYNIYNIEGKQVGDFACDGAKAFIDDIAAFKSGDLWGFVDSEGKIVVEPKYEDAKSFSNYMGAVKLGGMWNFVNSKGEIVIKEAFQDVSYLNETGLCFVKTDEYWSNIKMYYTGK